MEPSATGREELRAFARSVGHDFNNCLTGIVGAISLAQQDLPATSPARSRLEQAILSARRATFLARHLLSLSETSRAPANPGATDINEVLLQERRLFEMSLPAEAVLSYELAPSLPLARADALDLQAVCASLITNAGESLRSGMGLVSVKTGAEDEPARGGNGDDGAAGSQPGYVWLEVRDSGGGIPAEHLPHVEEPFFTTRAGHRGLGLFYVRSIACGLGGDVCIASSAEGTRVRVRVPRHDGERGSGLPKASGLV